MFDLRGLRNRLLNKFDELSRNDFLGSDHRNLGHYHGMSTATDAVIAGIGGYGMFVLRTEARTGRPWPIARHNIDAHIQDEEKGDCAK